MIEELGDIIEELADKLGIYGEERSFWVADFTRRVRASAEVEAILAAHRNAPNMDMMKKPEPDLRHLALVFRDIFIKPGLAGNEGRILMAMHQLRELLK
jgi:hypothetical protein